MFFYRDMLNEAFDFVFYLEEDRRNEKLAIEDFAKISMVGILRSFAKCTYVAPGMLVSVGISIMMGIKECNFTILRYSANN